MELRHAELAEEGLERLVGEGQGADLQASVAYWWPRVAASFGQAESSRFGALRAMGLRRSTNAELRSRWDAEAQAALARLGLTAA